MTPFAVDPLNRPARSARRTALAGAFLLLVLGCRKEPAPPPGVVALLGDRAVSGADFARYLDRNAGAPLAQLAPAAASALFDQYLDELLLAEEAAARGLEASAADLARNQQNDSSASVVERRDELRRSRLVSQISATMPGPSDAEIQKYYREHPEEFNTGDQVHARQILLHDEKSANQALAELRKGAPFEEVSKKVSRAPNADRGGDIGFVSRGQLPRVFEEAIFGLKPGEISEVIRTDNNFFHIFKVDEVAAAGTVSLQAARAVIEQKLREERLSAELDQIEEAARKRISVRVFPERLGFAYRGRYLSRGE